MYIDKFLKLRQLSPDPDGGGGTPFISLEDIDNEPTPEEAKKIADLAAEAAKQDATPPAAEPDPVVPEPVVPAEPVEPAPAADETEDSFWADVDTLRGEALEVDFGDVDPVSPEGVLLYEKAVREDEIAKFEADLAATHPRAYAFMEHILGGGKEEDFFKTAGEPGSLPTEAQLETDIELQKDIVTRNLKAKGNTDKQIERIIKSSIEEDDLEEMSKEALKEEAKRQDESIKAVREQTERETKFKAEKLKEMTNYVSDLVTTGKIGNVIVPEKDRAAFAKEFGNTIRIENGQYVSVTPISNDNITQLMAEKFFGFKKGDLNGLIEKAAATANTKRLQRTIVTTQAKPLANGQKGGSGLSTLAEMDD